MRLLVLTPKYLPHVGGAEILIHEVFRRLAARHDVTILTQHLPPQPMPDFDTSGYRIVHYANRLDFSRIRGKLLLRGAVPPFSLSAVTALRRRLSEEPADVVNVHFAVPTGLAAIDAARSGRPTLLSLTGRDSVSGPLTPQLWPRYANFVAQHVDHTNFISDYGRSFHTNLERVTVIPAGANVEALAPRPPNAALRQKLGITADQPVLFALQRLSAVKRVDVAIRAVAQLIENGYGDVCLLLGGTGPDEARLRQIALAEGIANQVRFIGFVPEATLPDYFALTDLFLFPSDLETFGITAAQAMAAGVPVVGVDSSSLPEVVVDGVTGLLSPAGDVGAFARNLAILLADPARRAAMGVAARTRAAAYYDWDVVAEQYERLFEQLYRAGSKKT